MSIRFANRAKNITTAVAEAAKQHSDKSIEVWATDEHRLGLKPVHRRVWAPVGERPIALGHHRFEWLHLTAFVEPTSGETFWYLSNAINKPFFEALLAKFAEEAGAGHGRIIILVLDNAGWHGPAGLEVPDGIKLVFLPPYSPELQPAEHLWPLVDEPVANKYFDTLRGLDQAVAERCRHLEAPTIRARTNFHWWPRPVRPN
ncbi:MAG: IS630 family transposase [Alphaproteobacteria bacterium]|nr:IS630 family transposase [Alphaproteobacteria bacterium]